MTWGLKCLAGKGAYRFMFPLDGDMPGDPILPWSPRSHSRAIGGKQVETKSQLCISSQNSKTGFSPKFLNPINIMAAGPGTPENPEESRFSGSQREFLLRNKISLNSTAALAEGAL